MPTCSSQPTAPSSLRLLIHASRRASTPAGSTRAPSEPCTRSEARVARMGLSSALLGEQA